MSQYRSTLIDRFCANVIVHGDGACWEWTGSKTRAGYGNLGVGRRGEGSVYAHRLAWEIANGPIPERLDGKRTVICHRCDNPGCVSPGHLFLGTQADNVADMERKGRARKANGLTHSAAKLTPEIVREIRANKSVSTRAYALRLGVAYTAVRSARSGKTWKWVDGGESHGSRS